MSQVYKKKAKIPCTPCTFPKPSLFLMYLWKKEQQLDSKQTECKLDPNLYFIKPTCVQIQIYDKFKTQTPRSELVFENVTSLISNDTVPLWMNLFPFEVHCRE